MKKGSILLTIGMPVYNEEKYIGEAIGSLLSQTYKDFILIISDNASTDRTPEICKHYAQKDNRIIYVRQKENIGSFQNGKFLINQAKTPFFLLAGGHDKWHPQFIKKLLPLIQEEEIVLAYPKTQMIEFGGNLGEIYDDNYTTTHLNNPLDRYLFFRKQFRVYVMTYGIWKTKALINCLPKKIIISSDRLILERATFEGKFTQTQEVLFYRRITRSPNDKHKYTTHQRQFFLLTGKSASFLPFSFNKLMFIYEHIKMFWQIEISLSSYARIKLSIVAIFWGIKRFFIKPSLRFLISVGKKYSLEKIDDTKHP